MAAILRRSSTSEEIRIHPLQLVDRHWRHGDAVRDHQPRQLGAVDEDDPRVDAFGVFLFDKPYYLLPAKGGDKAYALLREAIKESGQIGVAKFVLRSKQSLAAIEAIEDALVLSIMRFKDELATLSDYDFPSAKGVQKRDLQLAQRLISEFSSEWDPDKYTDDYRENIKKVIAAKQKRAEPELELEADPQSRQVVDLMERLRKSLGTKRAETAKAGRESPRRRAAQRKTLVKRSELPRS